MLSAINNWEQKNDAEDPSEANLVIVKEIYVDSARMLKEFKLLHKEERIELEKRSNHVTIKN